MESEFERDDEKRRTNYSKHDVEFEDAFPIFDGRPVATAPDTRYVEERYKTIAEVDSGFITVVWTPRDQRIRLISVRRASRAERRTYRALYGKRASG